MTTPSDLIERLAKESSLIEEYAGALMYNSPASMPVREAVESFAQLVAAHCAKLCDKKQREDDEREGSRYSSGIARDCRDEICKEFGITE